MILWCSAAFKQNADLLATYQERYLYLLVDEFQDTSGSQFELLMQLADYWDAPNLFVVGMTTSRSSDSGARSRTPAFCGAYDRTYYDTLPTTTVPRADSGRGGGADRP